MSCKTQSSFAAATELDLLCCHHYFELPPQAKPKWYNFPPVRWQPWLTELQFSKQSHLLTWFLAAPRNGSPQDMVTKFILVEMLVTSGYQPSKIWVPSCFLWSLDYCYTCKERTKPDQMNSWTQFTKEKFPRHLLTSTQPPEWPTKPFLTTRPDLMASCWLVWKPGTCWAWRNSSELKAALLN